MTRRRKLAPLVFTAAVAVSMTTAAVISSTGHSSRDLPNHRLTPGSTDPRVTQATIDTTVCVHGYTKTVRNVPVSERKAVFAAYHIAYASHASYELDHLISLELGGDNAATNLWPEPYAGAEGARHKDVLETRLKVLVCQHALALATAQHAIATDWRAALKQYG